MGKATQTNLDGFFGGWPKALPNLEAEKLILKLMHEEKGLGKIGGSISHKDQKQSKGLVSPSETEGREKPTVPNS